MDAMYDDYLHQAVDLQHKFHDSVDDASHPQVLTLKNEFRQLTEDFESKKSPRHLEDRLKQIEHGLLQAREQGEKLMSYQDIDNLNHQARRMREQMRKLPDYN